MSKIWYISSLPAVRGRQRQWPENSATVKCIKIVIVTMISYNPHIFRQFPSSSNNVITFKNRLFRLWNWFFITKVN